jgi:hypothetical protein
VADAVQAFGSVTGTGAWQRVSVTYTEPAGTTARTFAIIRVGGDGANDNTFVVDGVQLEVGTATTYMDGDQDGCQWVGEPYL